jgi:Uma2 family endonuclease
MPQPDILLVDRRLLREQRHAKPKDIFLAIEVADSSLSYDKGPKLQAYALTGIQEFWIVSLINDEILVHREPNSNEATYGNSFAVSRDEEVYPLAFPDVAIRVSEIII